MSIRIFLEISDGMLGTPYIQADEEIPIELTILDWDNLTSGDPDIDTITINGSERFRISDAPDFYEILLRKINEYNEHVQDAREGDNDKK